MWTIPDNTVSTDQFPSFDPVEVLYEFDGPRVFTIRDAENELHLVYWSDEDDDLCRYIAVPTTTAVVEELRTGGISLFDALNQPTCSVCHVTHQGVVKECRQVDFDTIPRDALPDASTLLLPELASPLALRAGDRTDSPR
jgi:hypothetical protein